MAAPRVKWQQKNKYGNRKIEYNGETFDSTKEYRRYTELLLLERAGAIQDLRRQVDFELVPAFYEDVYTGEYYKRGDRMGEPKMKRVCVEKAVVYYADFTYRQNGEYIVEDTKGFKTPEYVIKRKLMLHVHGIRIKEL